MDAIVFTSNTGFTEKYAKLLGEATGLPVYSLAKAKTSVPRGAEIIYLGWLMAGSVKGYKKALQRYMVRAIGAVGMSSAEAQGRGVRKKYAIPEAKPVFVLQGGYDSSKLHGVYKFMMKMMEKTAGKKLAEKENKSPQDLDMLDLLQNGGDRVSAEKLAPVLAWYKTLS
ncbi:MAG: hypothetical protein RR032_07315 [Oscillospiraceae bacterium]